MHDYLWMFKDSKTVNNLHKLRVNHSICFYEGTLSKEFQSKLKGDVVASIQLYEYILYDFILNESIHDNIDTDEKRSFYVVYQAIKSGELTKKKTQKKLSRELETVNFRISTIIDHEKYCKLYSEAKTPDYLAGLKDTDTTKYLNYIRIQNGIKIHEGTAALPWLMDSLPVKNDKKASIQLYEYVLYDFLFNDAFHKNLNSNEEKSVMNVLNAFANNQFMITEKVQEELSSDIITTNVCISKMINNKKYFQLYSDSTISKEEESMNFEYSDLHLYIEANKGYQKRRGPNTEKAS